MTKNLNLQIIDQYQVNQTTFRDCFDKYDIKIIYIFGISKTQVDLFSEFKNNEN